jgi:hypothetical protein
VGLDRFKLASRLPGSYPMQAGSRSDTHSLYVGCGKFVLDTGLQWACCCTQVKSNTTKLSSNLVNDFVTTYVACDQRSFESGTSWFAVGLAAARTQLEVCSSCRSSVLRSQVCKRGGEGRCLVCFALARRCRQLAIASTRLERIHTCGRKYLCKPGNCSCLPRISFGPHAGLLPAAIALAR